MKRHKSPERVEMMKEEMMRRCEQGPVFTFSDRMKRKHASVRILYLFNFSCGLSFRSSATTRTSVINEPFGISAQLI